MVFLNGKTRYRLEADDVDTVGIMANYNFTDNLSLEIKAGIPPKVDIKGKGKIYAPFNCDTTKWTYWRN
jgi:outer membrane protein W